MASHGGRGRSLPVRAGIGLRSPHVAEVLATRPAVPWLEVHPENYLGGGPAVRALEAIRRDYPVVASRRRAVGRQRRWGGPPASRADPEPRGPVRARPRLGAPRLEPGRGRLPESPPPAALHGGVASPLSAATSTWSRRPSAGASSSRTPPATSDSPPPRSRRPSSSQRSPRRTGCGLLCDVNNVYVTAQNLGLDPVAYLAALPADLVAEIHLAGHSVERRRRPDAPDRRPRLAGRRRRSGPSTSDALRRFGAVPTLVEWDTEVPPLEVLLAEAGRADARLCERWTMRPLPELQADFASAILREDAGPSRASIVADGLAARGSGPGLPEPRLLEPDRGARDDVSGGVPARGPAVLRLRGGPLHPAPSARRARASSSTARRSPTSSRRSRPAPATRTCRTSRGSSGR